MYMYIHGLPIEIQIEIKVEIHCIRNLCLMIVAIEFVTSLNLDFDISVVGVDI